VAEFWREPITNAKPAFAGDIPEIPGVPRVRWLIDEENMRWLLQAKGCVVCLAKFPDRPMKGNEHLFFGINWGRSWPEAKRLIRNQQCPICMSDVSPEMARALLVPDVWTDPANPGKVPL
jgi:hypothetical protein